MTVQPVPPVVIKVSGARGEGILDVARRLGLGGATSGSSDASAVADYSEYIANLVSDSVVAEAEAAKDLAEAAAANATGIMKTTADLLTFFGAPGSPAHPSGGTTIITAGRDEAGDGGGGKFWFNQDDTTSSDNGGTIRVDGQGRRWYAIVDKFFSPKLFGVKEDGSTDDTTALQAAFDQIGDLSASGTPAVMIIPPGVICITDTIKLRSDSLFWNGAVMGAGPANTTIKWTGSTDTTKAMLGLYTTDPGSIGQSEFVGFALDGQGKVGYNFLISAPAAGSPGLSRACESNLFRRVLFTGSKKASVLFGKDSVTAFNGLDADCNALDCNDTTFDNCTWYNFEKVAVKLTGGNIYNTHFRNCFQWSGNDTNVNSANATNYIFAIGAGLTNLISHTFQQISNTGANDGTDRIACVRTSGSYVHMDGVQSEDARIWNNDAYGDPDNKTRLNGVYVNDSRSINDGEYSVWNESSTFTQILGTSLGHLDTSDRHRKIYCSGGGVEWKGSSTSKATPDVFVIGDPARSSIEGVPLTDVSFLNKNCFLSNWAVGSGTFRNGSTADYYCNGFVKAFGTGAAGTLKQVALSNGRIGAELDCTTLGTGSGLRLAMVDNLDVTNFRGAAITCLVAGKHDGAYSSASEIQIGLSTDSGGGSSQGCIFGPSNTFVAWFYQIIDSSTTRVNFEIQNRKVGKIDLSSFAVMPDTGDRSAYFAIGQYAYHARPFAEETVLYKKNRLGEYSAGASQSFSETLADTEAALYYVYANHGDAGVEVSLVAAANYGGTVSITKTVLTTGGSGASISASAVGAVVTIAVDGTTVAWVRKVSMSAS